VSVTKSNLGVKIWDVILNEEPSPAVKRAIEAGLAEFEKHKKNLLNHLSENRHKSRPFDEEKWWLRLNHLAQMHFLWQAMPTAAKRGADLRKLAERLDRICRLAKTVRQDNVCNELVSQMFYGILPREPRGRVIIGEDRSIRVVLFPEIDFKQMLASLQDYQAAVLRAANDVPSRQRGPSPSLPESYIRALRDVYEESTGRSAGRGEGPFARFVMRFRAALDPSYKTTDAIGDERADESVIDAIKNALRRSRPIIPVNDEKGEDSSPFD